MKIMKNKLVLILLSLSTSVFAQQKDSVTTLKEVVVTATRSEISLED